MTKHFDARSYSVADFIEWQSNARLNLSPEFQRRSVWTRAAKSFLIDTVLRGKPMPKVLLTQDIVSGNNVRTVVDGQQRIRSIIEFVEDSYTVLASHNSEYAGVTFSQMDEETKVSILQYEIGVDLLYNVNRADLLDIFARINTYSVTLNRQEKLNAKYLGPFKTIAYELGYRYLDYLLEGGVLTHQNVSRMSEAELASDLLAALVDGIQAVSNIEKIYKKYEEAEEVTAEIDQALELYATCMKYIGAIYTSAELNLTNWRRRHWFYTLFTCVAHSQTSLRGLEDVPQPKLSTRYISSWRLNLDEISAQYDRYTDDDNEGVPLNFSRFIDYAKRRTTNTEARIERAKFVLDRIA